jgi:hypothetical protein
VNRDANSSLRDPASHGHRGPGISVRDSNGTWCHRLFRCSGWRRGSFCSGQVLASAIHRVSAQLVRLCASFTRRRIVVETFPRVLLRSHNPLRPALIACNMMEEVRQNLAFWSGYQNGMERLRLIAVPIAGANPNYHLAPHWCDDGMAIQHCGKLSYDEFLKRKLTHSTVVRDRRTERLEARFNPSILLRPAFDDLKSHARFKELVRRIGLPRLAQ